MELFEHSDAVCSSLVSRLSSNPTLTVWLAASCVCSISLPFLDLTVPPLMQRQPQTPNLVLVLVLALVLVLVLALARVLGLARHPQLVQGTAPVQALPPLLMPWLTPAMSRTGVEAPMPKWQAHCRQQRRIRARALVQRVTCLDRASVEAHRQGAKILGFCHPIITILQASLHAQRAPQFAVHAGTRQGVHVIRMSGVTMKGYV